MKRRFQRRVSFARADQRGHKWPLFREDDGTSGEGIFHDNTKVFLARIEIFRPDSSAPAALGSGDNHSIVEMQAIGGMGFDCAANNSPVRKYELDWRKRI
jgi:hypothetical protein